MPKKKMSTDDALALVLSGLKGEIPVSDLCRSVPSKRKKSITIFTKPTVKPLPL